MSRNYVIYDSDGGSDASWGLAILLKADRLNRVKLLAVTCCYGSASKPIGEATVNVYRILRAAGRLDIPIYWGAEMELIPPTTNDVKDSIIAFNGNDGLGDVLTEVINYKNITKSQNAVEAIHDFVNMHPREVTILTVGPLTNIALAMTMYGEHWYQRIKQIYTMGSNYKAVGNATSVTEFNFTLDPEAAHIFLKKATFPVIILPWEACIIPDFDISVGWRFSVLGAVNNPIVTLLNTVDTAQLTAKGYVQWIPADALLVAAFLYGREFILREKKWNGVVDVNGWFTRGQMLIDHLRDHRDNITLLEKVSADVFKTIVLWAVNSPTARSAFLQNSENE